MSNLENDGAAVKRQNHPDFKALRTAHDKAIIEGVPKAIVAATVKQHGGPPVPIESCLACASALDALPRLTDPAQYMPIVNRLITIAADHGGQFCVCGFGENTAPIIKLIPNRGEAAFIVKRFHTAITKIAATPGMNVYIVPALLRDGLPEGSRGKEADVLVVLAVVLDFDKGHSPETRHSRLPIHPHAETESSPGNYQTWFFLEPPGSVAEVRPLIQSLVTKAGADPGCQSCEHPFRVPGTNNIPSAKKIKDGRSPIPFMARLTVVPEDWESISFDELRGETLLRYPDAFDTKKTGSSEKAIGFDWNQAEKDEFNPFDFGKAHEYLSDTKYADDRSAGAFRFMGLCVRRGYSPEKLFAEMMRHADAPLMRHYSTPVDEGRVRADIIRAYTKKSEHLQREKETVEIFRICANAAAGGDASGSAEQQQEQKPPRVIQMFGGDLPIVVSEAEQALIEQGADIYQRGSMITRPAYEQFKTRDGSSEIALRLIEVGNAEIREQFTAAADFQRYSKTSEDWYKIDCPKDVAETYQAREGRWKLRRLRAVTDMSLLRGDGSLLDKPGYDEASGMMYLPGIRLPAIPREPSREDGLAALAVVKELIGTFPFTSPASRSVALSEIISATIRQSLPVVPLHANTAPVAGSGKGKLVDIASNIATGHRAPATAQGRSEEETEKRLASAFLAADAIVCLDNCTQALSGDFLCQAVSQEIVNIRILGRSQIIKVPNVSMLFATGNNLVVSGDMTRRVIRCEIDPAVERPELREFACDPVEVAKRERGKYVAAVLTAIRAFICAGRPQQAVPLGGFEAWSRLVRDALIWLGEADPCDTMEAISQDDPEREQLGQMIQYWTAVLENWRVPVKELIEAADANLTEGDKEARKGLYDALAAVAGSPGQSGRPIDPKRLGTYLGRHVNRIVAGHRIVRAGKTGGVQYWRVEKVK
jgi:hypothetical protein